MNTELIELRANVAMLQNMLDSVTSRIAALETPHSIFRPVVIHPECVTLDLPKSYDTVLGFLAKHHPDVLECFDYTDPTATQRDGYWLAHRCREQGIPPTYVDAPPVLQERDIVQVRAYPIDLLEQRWGA